MPIWDFLLAHISFIVDIEYSTNNSIFSTYIQCYDRHIDSNLGI
nr:MAG TPA: hypothetical protein [Caudoviricetes sp.]